jgi:hypothetical protein
MESRKVDGSVRGFCAVAFTACLKRISDHWPLIGFDRPDHCASRHDIGDFMETYRTNSPLREFQVVLPRCLFVSPRTAAVLPGWLDRRPAVNRVMIKTTDFL